MGLGADVRFLASPPKFFEGSVADNWQLGTATSGLPGADFLTIGTATTVYFAMGIFGIPVVYVYIGDLTPAATITYRTYVTLFGVIYYADHDDYVVGVDPNIMPVYAWVERGQVRIELMSDAVGDNGAAIPYEYSLKTY